MTAVAPTLRWASAMIWPPSDTVKQPFGMTGGIIPPGVGFSSVSLPHGSSLMLSIVTTGQQVVTFTGDITKGFSNLTHVVASPVGGLYVGMPVSCPLWQNGAWVTQSLEVNSLLVLAGAALVTATGVSFTAVDTCPQGTLAATVTPSTGTTITDMNFDGSYVGAGRSPTIQLQAGQTMSNLNWEEDQQPGGLSGQAEAQFTVAFASAGSFSISVAYTSQDVSYTNATSPPLAVTVT